MVDYYKTNEETLSVSVKEFVDEWYNKQEYMLVDIRELDERQEKGTIKNTFNISMYEIPDKIDMVPTYMNFLMLCQDGSRAEQVTKYIKNNGYKNILYIEGGIDSLLEAVPELKVN